MVLERMESMEGRKMEKLTVLGVDHISLDSENVMRILRGLSADGRQIAVRLGIYPKELLPGYEESRESRGFLKRLRDMSNGVVGRVIQAAGVGCAAMAGACGEIADTDNNPEHGSSGISGQFGVDESALTGDDVSHFGTPGPVSWSKWGDSAIEITEYEGKKVITFNRWVEVGDDGYSSMFYVECDELEKCITDGAPQEIQGLQENFPAFYSSEFPNEPIPPGFLFSFGSGTVFKNEVGQYQLLTGAEGLPFLADVEKNQDGILEASNFKSPPAEAFGSGPIPVGGVPHTIGKPEDSLQLFNLHTWGSKEVGPFPTMWECGDSLPHFSEEGSWVVAQKGKYVQGNLVCEFVSAASLEDLINQVGVKYLKNINDYNKTALGAWGGRIGQNVFIYVAVGPKGSKIYYALIESVPQPPADTVTNPPDVDAGSMTSPETGIGTDIIVGIDTASLDAALAETMKEVDGAVANPDSVADGKGADTQPDTQSNTDTLVSLCDDVEFEGDCDMSCNEPNATFTGKCTATVNIGGKFAKFEIDGEYTFNLLEKVGNLLKGGVQVDDKGVGIPTSYGSYDFVPTGTVYKPVGIVEGNFEMCKVLLKEGQITVSYNGEEIAVLNVGDEVTYIKGEPVVPVQPEEGEDASQPDAVQPDTGKDVGVSGEDENSVDTSNPSKDTFPSEKDTVQPKSEGGGGGGGGCSVSPAETSKTPKSGHAILFLAGVALGLIYRRFPHVRGL